MAAGKKLWLQYIYFVICTILLSSVCRSNPMTARERTSVITLRKAKTPADFDVVIRQVLEDLLRHYIKTVKRSGDKSRSRIAIRNRRKVRIVSRTGFFLEVLSSGKVTGRRNKTKYGLLELEVITPRVKRIKSLMTGKYLAINKSGKVITKDRPDLQSLFYEEQTEDFSLAFSSLMLPKQRRQPRWYVGLYENKNRKVKVRRASRTLPGDPATLFLTINSR